jgi:hypothetical protein
LSTFLKMLDNILFLKMLDNIFLLFRIFSTFLWNVEIVGKAVENCSNIFPNIFSPTFFLEFSATS